MCHWNYVVLDGPHGANEAKLTADTVFSSIHLASLALAPMLTCSSSDSAQFGTSVRKKQ